MEWLVIAMKHDSLYLMICSPNLMAAYSYSYVYLDSVFLTRGWVSEHQKIVWMFHHLIVWWAFDISKVCWQIHINSAVNLPENTEVTCLHWSEDVIFSLIPVVKISHSIGHSVVFFRHHLHCINIFGVNSSSKRTSSFFEQN